MALERVNESGQRREWRTQFMTGIGDKISTQFVCPPDIADVPYVDHEKLVSGARNMRLEMLRYRHRNDKRDLLRLACVLHGLHGVQQPRRAKHRHQRLTERIMTDQRL